MSTRRTEMRRKKLSEGVFQTAKEKTKEGEEKQGEMARKAVIKLNRRRKTKWWSCIKEFHKGDATLSAFIKKNP